VRVEAKDTATERQQLEVLACLNLAIVGGSVPDLDPDPPDLRVFWPPGFGSFYHHAKIIRKTLNPTIL